jgi:EpsI family protein
MNRRVLAVTITLVLSFGLRVWLSATPLSPKRESLAAFPKQAGPWTMVGETRIDDATADVLKADDYVMRAYRDEKEQQVDLFIAYYQTQKAGDSMHSPKNCLPGAGWGIVESNEVAMSAENPAHPIMINRYLIEKNGAKSLVLYWYQANGRVIASEYWGKIYLVLDALRTGRRDGAIVRFVVPIRKGSDGRAELQSGLDMARNTVPFLPRYVPD